MPEGALFWKPGPQGPVGATGAVGPAGPAGPAGPTPAPTTTYGAAFPGLGVPQVIVGPNLRMVQVSVNLTSTLGNNATFFLDVENGVGTGVYVVRAQIAVGGLVAASATEVISVVVGAGLRYQFRQAVAGGSTAVVVAGTYNFTDW